MVLRRSKESATLLSIAFSHLVVGSLTTMGLFFSLCFLAPDSHAVTKIMLDEGYEIRFDSGRFDADSFNMQMTNLEVLKNDARQWSAGAISMETIPLAESSKLIIKRLKIDGFVSYSNKIKIGKVIVQNVNLDKYEHLLAGEFGSLLDHALDNAYLGLFDFWLPIESNSDYEIVFQSIELTPVRRATLKSGSSYFNKIGVRGVAFLKHLRLHSPNENRETEGLTKDGLITQLNLHNFEIAFGIKNTLIEDGRVMRSELKGQIDIKNQLSTDIEFDVGIPMSSFQEFVLDKDLNIAFDDELSDNLPNNIVFRVLQSDASLLKLNLGFRDHGVFKRLINFYAKTSGQSVDAALEEIRLKIDQGIKENIPNQGPRLLPAIHDFLSFGGQLRFFMAPDKPVPFLLFVDYLLAPERAMEQLNLEAKKLN